MSVEEKKKTYLYGQRVMILRKEDLYYVTIEKWKISIGKKNNLSKNLKKKIREIFIADMLEKYSKEDVGKILNWIKDIAENRDLLLKDCFNKVQENYIIKVDNY